MAQIISTNCPFYKNAISNFWTQIVFYLNIFVAQVWIYLWCTETEPSFCKSVSSASDEPLFFERFEFNAKQM